jgi:trans-aconitate methyltransferase
MDHGDTNECFENRLLRGAEHYDAYVAPFIAPITERSIGALRLPVHRLLDHGAGTGAVSKAVLARWPDAKVTALDPNAEMVARIDDPRIDVRQGTLGTVPDLGKFDAIVSQIAIPFIPDEQREL